MMRARQISVAAFIWISSVHPSCALDKNYYDGRFNTRCYSWGRDVSKELCDVSFYRLIAAPEKYDGRLINVTGFIVESFGRLVLFPNKERYEADIQIEGIEINGAKINKEDLEKFSKGMFPVVVVGEFNAKYQGGGIPRLGMLNNVVAVNYAPRIPEK